MTINIEKGEQKTRELVPVKNHVARLYSIVEIGHVPNPFYSEEVETSKPLVHQVRLTWELPNELREFDGQKKPMVIGGKYTISMYEKANLRAIVDGMLGGLSEEDAENFDLRTLLGKTCLLQTGQKKSKAGNEYSYVISTSQVPEGLTEPVQVNTSLYLDYSDGWDAGAYEGLPQFIKDDMNASTEMKRRVSGSETGGEDIEPSDIPF